MKKIALSLAAVAALAAAPSVASAQATDQGTIEVSANISTVLTFGVASPLSFGAVTPGVAATGTGYIPLTRNVGAVLTLPANVNTGLLTLTGDATVTIQPSYTCGIGSTSAAIDTGRTFADCTPATGTEAVATLAAAGLVTEYVIFSGALTAAQTQATPGEYTGSIVILATQN